MKLGVFFLILIIGSAILLGYSSYQESSPLSYMKQEKKNVDFVIGLEEIDNFFSHDEIELTHSYRVSENSIFDYFKPSSLNVLNTVEDIVLTSTISNSEYTLTNQYDVGSFDNFDVFKGGVLVSFIDGDNIELSFNEVLPLGSYDHEIVVSYKNGDKYYQNSETYLLEVK